MEYGLIGRKLGHSYSPQIHKLLGNDSYKLLELEPQDLSTFLHSTDFRGINVTVPYKEKVIPYLTQLSPIARKLGAVNTIIKRADGKLIGHNTDYFGFRSMLLHSGLIVLGKKVLVLGSGGASKTVTAVLQEFGAEVIVISRTGKNNYNNLYLHKDCAVIVNTTPVGMYPCGASSPLSLDGFTNLEGVLDLIYNPSRTRLLIEAEKMGCTTKNGLWMLVAQAKESAEWFLGIPISDDKIQDIYQTIRSQMENIILIGMPGAGKTTIANKLGSLLKRKVVDSDALIEAQANCSIPILFSKYGEEHFRQLETQVLSDICGESRLIISTGGGCITRNENYPILHQNGKIFWIQRDISLLTTEGRPLSQSGSLDQMYYLRKQLYASFADFIIDNDGDISKTIQAIGRFL